MTFLTETIVGENEMVTVELLEMLDNIYRLSEYRTGKAPVHETFTDRDVALTAWVATCKAVMYQLYEWTDINA